MRRTAIALLTALLVFEVCASSPSAQSETWFFKLSPVLQARLPVLLGRSRVIVTATSAATVAPLARLLQLLGGRVLQTLPIVNGIEADVPNIILGSLAASALVQHVSIDRVAVGSMERTGATIGATAARNDLGYDG